MPRKKTSTLPLPATLPVTSTSDGGIGDQELSRRIVDDFFSAAYEELLRIATLVKNKNDGRAALSPSTLVNEAWLKLSSSHNLAFASPLHFKLTAARAMRQTLVDAARKRDSEKRGGEEVVFVTFDEFMQPVRCDREIMALHESLNDLARLSKRQAELVELRYFGGLNVSETASLLGISEATALRDWRAAKAWLGSEIRPK